MLSGDGKHSISLVEILSVVCIWIAAFLVGTIAIHLPGVYYDAVYPDYIAAVGAFPGVDNFTQITRHVGLPLLGNFYHGTMTAGVQYIILKCVGHAGRLTLRVVNLSYFAAAGSLVYFLCRKISKSNIIPLAGTLLCVTAPNVLALPRTQYYIMLPGCIFLFCSFYTLYTNTDKEGGFGPKAALLAGVFQGLAFYGYFTYLFFAPASVILIFFFSKGTKIQKIKTEFFFLWGILIGSIGYFAGYYDSVLTNLLGEAALTKILLGCGILCMLIYLAIPVYLLRRHENDEFGRKAMRVFLTANVIVLLLSCAVGVVIPFLYRDRMQSIVNLLVLSQTRYEGNRFLVFWQMMYMLVSGKSAQDVMFGEISDGLFGGYFYLGIAMTAVTAAAVVLSKKKGEKDPLLKYIGAGYLYLAVYYIFTLPISVGMQPQHFVATYFLLFLIIILDMVYVGRHMAKPAGIIPGLIVLVFGISLNISNDMAFLDILNRTEGRGKFSSALDKFAEEACLDEEKDHKIYVFPQWGFNANFIYLTENSCMTVRDADIDYDMLQEKLESGYTLVIAAFDKQEISKITENLEAGSWEWQEMESKEGDYVFACCTIAG